MRQHTSELLNVLAGSFERRLVVDVFHGSNRVAEGLAAESWSLNGDLGSQICYSGSTVLVIDSLAGESWSPVGTEGILSPFRAMLELVLEISAGDFRERVSLGMLRAISVPSAQDSVTTVDGEERVVSSRVVVDFRSKDEEVGRASFPEPVETAGSASSWGEIRRLAQSPVEISVPDVPVPSTIVWEPKQRSRLDALHELGRILGGTLIVNSRGAVTVVPDSFGEPVGVLRLGEYGTVIEVGSVIDTDTVYNVVVGTFETADRAPLYAVARVESGDLAVGGLYGANVRYYSSDRVKTQEQADAAVKAVLAESIGSQMYDVQIQCHINPLVEIGDVWALEGWTAPLSGRVVKVSLSDSELMNVTLRVKRELA